MLAVVYQPVGEVDKEANHRGWGASLTPPPGSIQLWEDSQTVPKVPLKETGETFSRVETQQVFLHDAIAFEPMWAAILDPGFTIPMPAPPPSAPVQAAGALSEAQLREVLSEAGWPVELHDQAVAIVHCESRFRPDALGDAGRSGGLFQLNIATWFRYAGEDASQWHDPLVNARTAWATYQYDIGRGYVPWKQWSCRKVLD